MAPGDLGYSFIPFLASPFEGPSTTRFLEPRGRGGRTFRRAASAACPHPPSRSSPLRAGVPPGRVRGAKTTVQTRPNRNASPPAAGGLTGEASLVPKADRAMGNILYTGSILGFFAIGERWDRVPITMPSEAAP